MFYMNVNNIKYGNVYKQIFIDHWDGFKKANPWYDTGRGNRVIPMSCKSYLCLSCGKVQ